MSAAAKTVESTRGGPRLAVGTIDVRGVRFVRLDHVLCWLEDYRDFLAFDQDVDLIPAPNPVEEVRATLAQVAPGAAQ